jgi:hypothetical protein
MRALRVLAWVWVSLLLVTGAAGGILMDRVGWALAMGLSIYGGDTEPVRVEMPYAWSWFVVAATLAICGLAWSVFERRRAAHQAPKPSVLRAALPLALTYLGALTAAVMPFVHLFRLVALVRSAP